MKLGKRRKAGLDVGAGDKDVSCPQFLIEPVALFVQHVAGAVAGPEIQEHGSSSAQT